MEALPKLENQPCASPAGPGRSRTAGITCEPRDRSPIHSASCRGCRQERKLSTLEVEATVEELMQP